MTAGARCPLIRHKPGSKACDAADALFRAIETLDRHRSAGTLSETGFLTRAHQRQHEHNGCLVQ
jgi:hypothetical protein